MAQEVLGEFNEGTAVSLSKTLGEPAWLTEFRVNAARQFQTLPLEKSALYSKYATFTQLDPGKFPLRTNNEPIDFRSFFGDYLSGRERNILLQANEQEIHSELDEKIASEGVVFTTLSDALIKNEPLVKDAFQNKPTSSEGEKYAAFTNAFFNSGTFVYVPAGVEVKEPLRRMLLTSSPRTSVLGQTIIVADEGSKLTFLEELYSKEGKTDSLVTTVTDIDARAGAGVDFSCLQLLDEKAAYVSNKNIRAANDSKVTTSAIFLGSRITRSRMNLQMKGRGSVTEGLEIFFTSSDQRYDFESNLLHDAPDSTGSIMARGALKDESQSVFKGMIKIVNAAKNSRSYLAHHAMILDRRAKSDGVPSLEIDTNEVKATHSASVAQVDEEQVFYLMARGLTQEEAKKTIVLGFFEPVLSRIPVEQTREGARFIIEGKWKGEKRRMVDHQTLLALTGEAVLEAKQPEDIFERHYKYRK
jgi:FeS assembly protein SufD